MERISAQKQQKYLAIRRQLRHILATRFDESDLRTLCFDLGVSYDALPGQGTGNKARELVAYLERRNRLAELVRVGRQLRPDIHWSSALQVAGEEPPGDADIQTMLNMLRDGSDTLETQLLSLSTESWRRPDTEPPPTSLAAFVSLDDRVREAAVRSVRLASNLDDAEKRLYAQVLVGMLRDESYLVVWEAVRSLGHVNTPLAVEGLLKVCRTRDDEIVYKALATLGQLGDTDTVLALEELKTLEEMLPILRQAEEETRATFLQAVDEAISAISARLRTSPKAHAEYVLKAKE